MANLIVKLTNASSKEPEYVAINHISRMYSTKEKTVEKDGKSTTTPSETVLHIIGVSEPLKVIEHVENILRRTAEYSHGLNVVVGI